MKFRAVMLLGMGINLVGLLILLAAIFGGGWAAVWLSIKTTAVGTAMYYVARFLLWFKEGHWDNTGLSKSS